MLVILLGIFLVLGLYLVAWGFLFLKIFPEDVLAYFLRWIFIMDLLNLFLILVFYLFSIHYRVREVGHHPLKRQPQPKLEQVRLWQWRFRRGTRTGTI